MIRHKRPLNLLKYVLQHFCARAPKKILKAFNCEGSFFRLIIKIIFFFVIAFFKMSRLPCMSDDVLSLLTELPTTFKNISEVDFFSYVVRNFVSGVYENLCVAAKVQEDLSVIEHGSVKYGYLPDEVNRTFNYIWSEEHLYTSLHSSHSEKLASMIKMKLASFFENEADFSRVEKYIDALVDTHTLSSRLLLFCIGMMVDDDNSYNMWNPVAFTLTMLTTRVKTMMIELAIGTYKKYTDTGMERKKIRWLDIFYEHEVDFSVFAGDQSPLQFDRLVNGNMMHVLHEIPRFSEAAAVAISNLPELRHVVDQKNSDLFQHFGTMYLSSVLSDLIGSGGVLSTQFPDHISSETMTKALGLLERKSLYGILVQTFETKTIEGFEVVSETECASKICRYLRSKHGSAELIETACTYITETAASCFRFRYKTKMVFRALLFALGWLLHQIPRELAVPLVFDIDDMNNIMNKQGKIALPIYNACFSIDVTKLQEQAQLAWKRFIKRTVAPESKPLAGVKPRNYRAVQTTNGDAKQHLPLMPREAFEGFQEIVKHASNSIRIIPSTEHFVKGASKHLLEKCLAVFGNINNNPNLEWLELLKDQILVDVFEYIFKAESLEPGKTLFLSNRSEPVGAVEEKCALRIYRGLSHGIAHAYPANVGVQQSTAMGQYVLKISKSIHSMAVDQTLPDDARQLWTTAIRVFLMALGLLVDQFGGKFAAAWLSEDLRGRMFDLAFKPAARNGSQVNLIGTIERLLREPPGEHCKHFWLMSYFKYPEMTLEDARHAWDHVCQLHGLERLKF